VRSSSANNIVVSTADGVVSEIHLPSDPLKCRIASVFTGNEIDPIYALAIHDSLLVSGGRDGLLRCYAIPSPE
jgi:hypothetical protein